MTALLRGFAARAEALDQLEFQVVEGPPSQLRDRLQAANDRVLRTLRRQITLGRSTPEGLKRAFERCAGPAGPPGSYDTLDLLVGGLLAAEAPPEARKAREPEMVFYQPTPARAVLALIERAKLGPDDVFYDLGSGLGQVVILVSLLTGALARGIEFEPAYVEYSEACARRLNVPRASFIQADAREAPLSDGTLFFLYTPFRGALLQQVLERLRALARHRPLRIATFGPCTSDVCKVSWLALQGDLPPTENEIAVFEVAR